MIEPKNPIMIMKDGAGFFPALFTSIEPPFVFMCKDIILKIEIGDTPNYFTRKTSKGILNLRTTKVEMDLIAIKYRIEKTSKEGLTKGYWIDKDGKIINEL